MAKVTEGAVYAKEGIGNRCNINAEVESFPRECVFLMEVVRKCNKCEAMNY